MPEKKEEKPALTLPQMQAVDSSNVQAVGYDAASSKLYVAFKHGGTYSYAGVPPEVHKALVTSESVGGYLAKNVKGTYAYTKEA